MTEDEAIAARELFDAAVKTRTTAVKVGRMKLKRPDDSLYAVAVRDGADLWLVIWVKRSRRGEFFIGIGSARRLSATKSSTAMICSRLTSNCSTTSSIPRSSRFSMIVATGKRVPLNTQAPPTLPGILSTAGHRDQSRVATRTPSLQTTAKSRGRHAGSSDGSEIGFSPQLAGHLVPTPENATPHLSISSRQIANQRPVSP